MQNEREREREKLEYTGLAWPGLAYPRMIDRERYRNCKPDKETYKRHKTEIQTEK